MKSEINDLEKWVEDTIASLKPSERAKVLKKIGVAMRRNTQTRMSHQVAPDGEKWEARKTKSRKKMMAGLKLARKLKMKARNDEVSIGWRGRDGLIARTHHHGLRERLKTKNLTRGVTVKYASREMLGLSDSDTNTIDEIVENWIGQE